MRLENADEFMAALDGQKIVIGAKVGEEGQLFGSITTAQVADAINARFNTTVDRKRIDLHGLVKTAGEHTATISIYRDIKAAITLEVVDENVLKAQEEAAAEAAASERTAKEGADSERADSERAADEQAAGERAAGERAADEFVEVAAEIAVGATAETSEEAAAILAGVEERLGDIARTLTDAADAADAEAAGAAVDAAADVATDAVDAAADAADAIAAADGAESAENASYGAETSDPEVSVESETSAETKATSIAEAVSIAEAALEVLEDVEGAIDAAVADAVVAEVEEKTANAEE
jgi:hypothetical protein